MGWKQFAVEFVRALAEPLKAIAWPAAVSFAVWALRPSLLKLLLRLKKLKHKETEVEFDQKLEEAEAKAEAVPVTLPPVPAQPPEAQEALPAERAELSPADLAPISPRAAILAAYVKVEKAAARALRSAKGTTVTKGATTWRRVVPGHQIRRVLEQNGVIDSSTGALLDDLRTLRNLAAHDEDIDLTSEQAIKYVELAERVAQAIYRSSERYDHD